MKKFKKIVTLEVSKIKKEKLQLIKGGCTAGTKGVCHIDGTNDAFVH